MTTYTLLARVELLRTAAASLGRDKRGQDLIEYALLAGFVAVAAGAIFPTTLSPNISRIFSKIGSILVQA
jgi:hypothetical protein